MLSASKYNYLVNQSLSRFRIKLVRSI